MDKRIDNHSAVADRRQWVQGFNDLMIKMWQEQIIALGVIDTSSLYRSVKIVKSQANDTVTEVMLGYSFNEYGIYVDRGTGRETPRGNPGDIGREKRRVPRPWFSKKFFKSYYSITRYFARSLGEEFCAAIPQILTS